MATGFSVMDALNKNSKAGVDESPRARFRTKDISIFKMYRNKLNFYDLADIEELAGDILMYGLKQNLEVVFEPNEQGEYRIVAGERRWLALKHLVEQGYKDFEIATCKLTTPQDEDEEQVEIIIANAYRTKSLKDVIEEEQRLKLNGGASDITKTSYGGNAMSEIPLIWVKRWTQNNYHFVVFCEEQYDDTYKAYAHTDAAWRCLHEIREFKERNGGNSGIYPSDCGK